MKLLNVKNTKRTNLEIMCSVFFVSSVILNDALGAQVGLNWISKSFILLFMVCSFLFTAKRGVQNSFKSVILFLSSLIWWTLTCVWTPSNASLLLTLAQNILLGILVFFFFYESKNYNLLFYALFYSALFLLVYSLSVYGLSDFFKMLAEEDRIGGDITNANTFGKIFSYGIISGVYFALYKHKKLYALGSLLFLVFSLSSGSRKAIAIVLVGVLLLVVFRYGLKHPIKLVFFIAVTVLLMYFALRLPIFSVARERLEMLLTGNEKDSSSIIRYRMIDVGVDLFLQKPVAGWGMNAYATVSGFNVYSHNNFIEMLVNYGIIGFALYYAIYAYVFLKLLPFVKSKSPCHIMMFSIMFTSIIMDYGNVSYSSKWTWIVIGAAVALAATSKKEKNIRYEKECTQSDKSRNKIYF